MGIGEHTHWHITDKCNINCNYCFKPNSKHKDNIKKMKNLAEILVKNNIKKVTIGGGEPTLIKSLDKILEILKEKDIYISLHTNGILLDDELLSRIAEFVDDIGLPIDSINQENQKYLREDKFMPTWKNLFKLVEKILDKNIKIGYHTVFTAVNHKEMPRIYKKIKKLDFDYWRIYEFNLDLALSKFFVRKKPKTLENQKKHIEKFREVQSLYIEGTAEKGFSDCLLAYFLLTEEKMNKLKDNRIQFVAFREKKEPYAFLNNSGDIKYYCWFSQKNRKVLGNLFKNRFSTINKKLEKIDKDPWDLDDDFYDGFADRPVWACFDDGFFAREELEVIDEKYIPIVEHLGELYSKREERVFQ